jgi:hypothetical protein
MYTILYHNKAVGLLEYIEEDDWEKEVVKKSQIW